MCGFEMHTEDGRTVIATAKEREAARKEHEQAIEQGLLTGLVEHVQDDGVSRTRSCLPCLRLMFHSFCCVLGIPATVANDHYETYSEYLVLLQTWPN